MTVFRAISALLAVCATLVATQHGAPYLSGATTASRADSMAW